MSKDDVQYDPARKNTKYLAVFISDRHGVLLFENVPRHFLDSSGRRHPMIRTGRITNGCHDITCQEDLVTRGVFDEFRNVLIRGIVAHFLWRADLDDGSVLHDGHAIDDADCLREIVRNEYARLAQEPLQT